MGWGRGVCVCVCVCVAKPVAVELRCHATALIFNLHKWRIYGDKIIALFIVNMHYLTTG